MNWTRGPPCWYIRNISSTPGDLITRPAARDLRVGRCMWWVYYGRCWWISMFMESLRRGRRNKKTPRWTTGTMMSRESIVMVKFTYHVFLMCFFLCLCVCVFPLVKLMILVFLLVCVCSKWCKHCWWTCSRFCLSNEIDPGNHRLLRYYSPILDD